MQNQNSEKVVSLGATKEIVNQYGVDDRVRRASRSSVGSPAKEKKKVHSR